MDILIECARVKPDTSALRRAADAVADWNGVLVEGRRQGLLPLLHWRLSRTCVGVAPPDAAARLAVAFHAVVRRNLEMAAELRTVLGWLGAAGVPAIAFKGPTLAALVYENVGLREFVDLDIVVRPRDRVLAHAILVSNGCRDKSAPGACSLAGNSEIALTTPRGCEVDLHWTVSPPYFLPFDAEPAFERVQTVPLAGADLPTFGSDDLFACLALHGARHGWGSLAWICDVAGLLRVASPDWDRLLADRRTRRAFRLAAVLAADLLSAPVPREVIDAARDDRTTGALARKVRARLFDRSREDGETMAGVVMHLQVMTSPGDKARYLYRRALQPNQTDNDFLPLPERLRFLLWVVRPLRLLVKTAAREKQRSHDR